MRSSLFPSMFCIIQSTQKMIEKRTAALLLTISSAWVKRWMFPSPTSRCRSITRTLNAEYLTPHHSTYPVSAFITHLVYLRGGEVPVDVDKITVRFTPAFDASDMLTYKRKWACGVWRRRARTPIGHPCLTRFLFGQPWIRSDALTKMTEF